MFKKLLNYSLIAVLITPLIFSCNNDEDNETPPPPTGTVSGVVTDDASSDTLVDVRVSLYNSNNNQTVGSVYVTGADGFYSFTVAGGSYYIKLTKQGFQDIPVQGTSALPFTINNGNTLTNNFEMSAHTATDLGWITGKITSSDASISGCLVVASGTSEGYSTISNSDGTYVIYNVPAAAYMVKAWKQGVNSPDVNASVTTGAETSNVDLAVTTASGSSVTGTITFLATSNIEVDVALTHPVTAEVIPGLNTNTSSSSYTLNNVPDGLFLARATFVNDGVVMDPDWIVKNGEPYVTVAGGSITRDFSVTGAVELNAPTNDATSTVPVPTSSTPTFEWKKYSSTSDYVIEVSDANGNVIWGGFSNNWTVKNITIPSSQNSIMFDSDGNATEALQIGKVYRWRIYASKDNTQSPTGWELISVSEDQRGLIIIE